MVDHQDYPPVVLGRLDDKRGWHWLGTDKPDGWLDWVLTLSLVAVACTPFLLIYCPLCWVLRRVLKVGERC